MNKSPRRPRGATVRTTFDLERALHKRLQFASIEENASMVEIAEQGIRNMLDALDDPTHDWAYHEAYEAGRRAGLAEAQDAVRVVAEAAQPLAVVAPVVPAPVRSLPTRPPTVHPRVQS